jgi:hypothetical protein
MTGGVHLTDRQDHGPERFVTATRTSVARAPCHCEKQRGEAIPKSTRNFPGITGREHSSLHPLRILLEEIECGLAWFGAEAFVQYDQLCHTIEPK